MFRVDVAPTRREASLAVSETMSGVKKEPPPVLIPEMDESPDAVPLIRAK
jgi:hypothetical protein